MFELLHRRWLLIPVVLWFAAIAFFVFDLGEADLPRAEIPRAEIVGPREMIFDWSESACEPIDIPDFPARAFRDARGQVQLITSSYIARRMTGPSLDQVHHSCDVVMRSDYDPDPAKFNDREWLASPYTRDGRTVLSLVHNEFQAHRHPGRCTSASYLKCWYNAITLAVSNDGGRSYADARPPPRHLIASVPYRYESDRGPLGVFEPSNIIYKRDDGHYYALFHVEKYEEQKSGACLMRTRDLGDPKSWRAWDGEAFTIRFSSPYDMRPEVPSDHVCEPVAEGEISKMSQSLTFNTYFDKFLLVGIAGRYDAARDRNLWGAYFSLSDDLIDWSERQLIMEAEVPWSFQCGDRSPILHPAVLDPSSSDRNFSTTDRHVYLYFTQFNYSGCQQTLDRDLVRFPIRFNK